MSFVQSLPIHAYVKAAIVSALIGVPLIIAGCSGGTPVAGVPASIPNVTLMQGGGERSSAHALRELFNLDYSNGTITVYSKIGRAHV